MLKLLNESYVPGVENRESRLLSTVSELEILFQTLNGRDEGIYKCSCDAWYQYGPCGMPQGHSVFKCHSCGLDVGGIDHKIVKRAGHLRIYKNQALRDQACTYSKRYGPFEGMLFDELKAQANELLKKEPKGIIKTLFRIFKSPRKQIRQLNPIAYRLLSLLLYSILFYGEVMDFIKPEELKTILMDKKTSRDLLVENWIILQTHLETEGVGSIQIFLNLIFVELESVIAKYKHMNTQELRLQFEKEIVDLTTRAIQNYSRDEIIYTMKNAEYLNRNPTSMKTIVSELEQPSNYSEDEYPFYKYFLLDNFTKLNDTFQQQFDAILDSSKMYPILFNCLKQREDIDKLQNVILINPFVNYMNDRYSYQTTRDNAKKKTIENELKQINDEAIDKLYSDFEEGYNQVAPFAIKYKCQETMNIRTIKKTDSIAYCLPDDGEMYFGMYLAVAYLNFITWQNGFLNLVYDSLGMNRINPYQKEAIKKKIAIQDAKKTDIVTTTISEDNSMFNCLDDLVGYYSFRNCFSTDGSINYAKYKLVEYKFDLIENELNQIILPGKKLFNDEIRFVTYGFEGSRNKKSSVIIPFLEKYSQIELKQQDEKQLSDYMKLNKENKEQLMFSIQLLIFYISDKRNFPAEKAIHEIIAVMPKYIILSNACIDLFDKNKYFQVNQLIKVFEYIELLCYQSFLDNMNIPIEPILDFDKMKILKYLSKLNKDSLVNKDNLATAVRRFICRKLIGKKTDLELKLDADIMESLTQPEFWNKEVGNNDKLEEIIYIMFPGIKIQINQAIEFYTLIGEKELKIINSMKTLEEKEQNNNQNQQQQQLDLEIVPRQPEVHIPANTKRKAI